MFLIPIRHSDEPTPRADSWRTYALSADEEGNRCDFLNQLFSLDQADVRDFFAWLLHFQRLCAAHPKRPLKELIKDSDKLHSVGTAKLHTGGATTQETVWQFTHGRIRVLWCYGGDGRIVLLGRVLIKKQQKTKRADVKMVEKAMQQYFDAKTAGTLKIAGD